MVPGKPTTRGPMNHILNIFLSIVKVINDEELLGVYLEDFARTVVKPFVFAYVCGLYAGEMKTKFVTLIEPKTPDFYLN